MIKSGPFETKEKGSKTGPFKAIPLEYVRKYTLPDGTELPVGDEVPERLFGAFMIHQGTTGSAMELFPSHGMSIPGSEDQRVLNRGHTNVLRSSDSGLPKDWVFYAQAISARLSEPLVQEVLDFAAVCQVAFVYNDKYEFRGTLLDLVHGAAPLETFMRECLSYKVVVQIEEIPALERLKVYLRKRPGYADVERVERRLVLLAQELSEMGILKEGNRTVNDKTLCRWAEETKVLSNLVAGTPRQLTGWIYLHGPMSRVVY